MEHDNDMQENEDVSPGPEEAAGRKAGSPTERDGELVDGEGEPIVALTMNEYERLQEDLEKVRLEAEKHLDSWQRALADYNNLRRRTEIEREQMRGELVGKIIGPFLDVLDDLDLAVRSRPAEGGEGSWGEGIELVYRKLLSRLESAGVRVMQVEGLEFDPHFHEAITHEENEAFESGRIIAVVKPGYLIGDRVLKPAMVRVAA
ncbi:MAG TPA: nucleotide exchange factor GrpE [Anaerolineales bacterium]|nr:nucleotide exchange factor GrpE [Anaerolineales bacterium]